MGTQGCELPLVRRWRRLSVFAGLAGRFPVDSETTADGGLGRRRQTASVNRYRTGLYRFVPVYGEIFFRHRLSEIGRGPQLGVEGRTQNSDIRRQNAERMESRPVKPGQGEKVKLPGETKIKSKNEIMRQTGSGINILSASENR